MARITTTGKILVETFIKEDTNEHISSKVKERHPVETARMKGLVSTLSYPKMSDQRKECGCWNHGGYCKHQDPKEEAQKAKALAKKQGRNEQAWRKARNSKPKGRK